MLLTIFGTPSALSYATLDIVRAIIETTHGHHAVVQAVFISDFKTIWSGLDPSARKVVVFFSDCPHPELVDLIIRTQAPIIVVADDIEDIVGYVMETRGMELPYALRFTTQVVSALDVLFQSVETLRVRPSRYDRDIDALVADIIDFFGVPCRPDQFDTVSSRLKGGADSTGGSLRDYMARVLPAAIHSRERLRLLSTEEQEIVRELAREYSSILGGRSLASTSWPGRLFLDWGRPGAFLASAIDLTGPSRFIICGPYLHLPAGAWRAEVEIEVRDCLSANGLGVDVFSGRILSAVSMKLPARGAYAFDIEFETADPLLPVELRFQLTSGAIEGELSLLGVRITRRDGKREREALSVGAPMDM